MTTKPNPRAKLGDCDQLCAGDNPCVLSDKPHTLYICKDPDCICHRYATAVTERGGAKAVTG